MEQASENLLRLSMELGGNAPFIVFEDADLDDAVAGRADREDAQHRRGLHGRQPLPRRRRRWPSEFAEKLAEKMGAMKVGRGTEDGVEVGPLIDADAARQGRRARRGRRRPRARARSSAATPATAPATSTTRPSSPTCPTTRALLQEEIFGPVAPVRGFADEDEAIAAANDTEFGLVAYVYTSDLKRALRVVERLETGMVGLNQGIVSNPAAPFGGIKQSGFGREGGPEGIEEYLETKYVAINL